MQQDQQKRIEFTTVVLIATIFLAVAGYYFAAALEKGSFVKKQQELRNLATTIFDYELSTGNSVRNPNGNSWCQVDAYYESRRCLGELERDGFITALPISPDDQSYYFKYVRGTIYVGTPITTNEPMPNANNKCYGNNGEVMWCYSI